MRNPPQWHGPVCQVFKVQPAGSSRQKHEGERRRRLGLGSAAAHVRESAATSCCPVQRGPVQTHLFAAKRPVRCTHGRSEGRARNDVRIRAGSTKDSLGTQVALSCPTIPSHFWAGVLEGVKFDEWAEVPQIQFPTRLLYGFRAPLSLSLLFLSLARCTLPFRFPSRFSLTD